MSHHCHIFTPTYQILPVILICQIKIALQTVIILLEYKTRVREHEHGPRQRCHIFCFVFFFSLNFKLAM